MNYSRKCTKKQAWVTAERKSPKLYSTPIQSGKVTSAWEIISVCKNLGSLPVYRLPHYFFAFPWSFNLRSQLKVNLIMKQGG
jgi:hypothetical protein